MLLSNQTTSLKGNSQKRALVIPRFPRYLVVKAQSTPVLRNDWRVPYLTILTVSAPIVLKAPMEQPAPDCGAPITKEDKYASPPSGPDCRGS
jgi:hypothetical protein